MSAPPLVEAAIELLTYLVSISRPACLIGGMVVGRWGEPRATQDVGATVLADFGEELVLFAALLEQFRSRDANPGERARLGRLALLEASNGVRLDLSFAGFPFEREALDRASDWRLAPEIAVSTCSAEDLLIYNLVAGRPQDLADIESIVKRQAPTLDVNRVRHWGQMFAEIKPRPFEAALLRAIDD